MGSLPPQTLEILHPSTVGAARRAARALGESIGFDPAARDEIVLAMTRRAIASIAAMSSSAFRFSWASRCTVRSFAFLNISKYEISARESQPWNARGRMSVS